METRPLIVLALAVLIRVPFLDQPVQGDDVYYLAIARNALDDPLHPMQMGYTFQGRRVSMAGFPHPPLNAYLLAGLLRVFGEVRETAFHLAYAVFSLAAAWGMYVVALRFSERPALAACLFVATPAFVVNGNTLESDLPFLALWMVGMALYLEARHLLGAVALGLAALSAYQAVLAAPILAYHVWYRRRRAKTAWVTVLAAPAALAAWQLFELASTGGAPGATLAGYLQELGLWGVLKKLSSALALTGHLGWIVFPAAILLVARGPAIPAALLAGVVALVLPGYTWWQRGLWAVSAAAGLAVLFLWGRKLWKERAGEDGILAAWGVAFFAGAMLVFFAGSARYLLPLAAPVVLAVVRVCPRPRVLWAAVAANLALGLGLASANYHHAQEYRRFARHLAPLAGGQRLWSNAEWGLRYYLEQAGGEPLVKDQPVYAPALVVTSQLAGPIAFSAGGGRLQEVAREELQSRRVRLFGLETRSGYSSSSLGVLPFEPGGGRLDSLRAKMVRQSEPRVGYLRLGDPESSDQLVTGFYAIEENAWRWMGEQGVAILKAPEGAARFEMTFFIPETAPARRVTVSLDGAAIAAQDYPSSGRHTLSAPASPAAGAAVRAVVAVDRTFQPAGDLRRLGIIVQELGLR